MLPARYLPNLPAEYLQKTKAFCKQVDSFPPSAAERFATRPVRTVVPVPLDTSERDGIPAFCDRRSRDADAASFLDLVKGGR